MFITIRRVSRLTFWAFTLCFSTLVVIHDLRAVVSIDWQRMQRAAEARFGAAGGDGIRHWRQLIEDQGVDRDVEARLRAVNDFFNQRVRWTSDEALFGQADYWATPLEMLALAAGDCEDFSIAKYVTLLALGVPPASLRLVYVSASRPGLASQAHMVVAWYPGPDETPLILDNINPALLPASEREDLQPIFSFNHSDLWVGAKATRSSANSQARMGRWRQVLQQIATDGMTIN